MLYQAQKAIDELSLFFFTNPTVSLHLIGDAHLKNAFAALGVSLPGRTALGGTLLDKQHALAVERVLQNGFGGVLDAVEAGQFDNIIDMYGLGKLPVLAKAFALASDGWRRKLCAQGTPLINLMIIPDEGPAVFIKVSGYPVEDNTFVTPPCWCQRLMRGTHAPYSAHCVAQCCIVLGYFALAQGINNTQRHAGMHACRQNEA